MRLVCAVVAAASISVGCGSIGQPLPPALHIPQRVLDLSAIEQGDKIQVQFTVPIRTTENLLIQKPLTAELGVGPGGAPLDPGVWEANATRVANISLDNPNVKYGVPAAPWIGKDVVIAVRVLNEKDRAAGWSNLVTLSVIPPIAPPTGLESKDVTDGVQLAWHGDAATYRVFRRMNGDENSAAIAETERAEYTDTKIEYGKTYHYSVEGFRAAGDVRASSDRTPEVDITPQDKWPPPVPTGLAAVVSPGRVELVWDRNMAPDLAGYNIYRAEGDGAFTKIGEARQGPSYGDHSVVAGKTYRYAVSSFDQIPNESEKSAPVAIQAQ